ncbi:hypothetical protein D3C72_2161320 [compost metagenome]
MALQVFNNVLHLLRGSRCVIQILLFKRVLVVKTVQTHGGKCVKQIGGVTVFFDPILNRDKACQTRYQNGNGDE